MVETLLRADANAFAEPSGETVLMSCSRTGLRGVGKLPHGWSRT